jgi:methionyl-tRNA synthetase
MAPVTPKVAAKLWSTVGQGSLGDLASQPLSAAANWGQLKPGQAIGELEPLFPRIETDATEAK